MSFINRMTREFKQNNNEQVRFQSGMTSQQKFNSIAESVLSTLDHSKQVSKGCALHPKISKKCRKCQQLEKSYQMAQKEQQIELSVQFPQLIKVNTNNMKSHFNQKLQKNIEEAQIYRVKLKKINNVRNLVNDLTSEEISIDAYRSGSNDNPTDFICYFYRLAELRPTREQLVIMLKANNVNIRCMALLYLRVYADPIIVYGCVSNSFNDNKLLTTVTVGEYALRLFDQEQLNHGGFRIPRLPIKIQKAIQKRINLIKEKKQKELEKELEREKERQRERERSRSRDKKRRMEQQMIGQQRKKKAKSSSSSSSQSDQKQKKQSLNEPPLSLKEKVRLIEQKQAAQMRRKEILSAYKSEQTNKLQSEEQAYDQNDSVQKFQIGR